MRTILILRDSLRKIYADYDTFIRPLIKFVLAFFILYILQSRLGYNARLSKPAVMLACSLLCAFFPYGFIAFAAGGFLIADMFEVSYTMTLFSVIVLLMIFVLYYGFRPGTGIIMALTPLAFYFKIPFLVPIVLGLSAGIGSALPAVLGVLIWELVRYFGVHAGELQAASAADMFGELIEISEAVLKNEYMYVVMFAFVLCIVTVSVISKSSINHAWTIGVAAGAVILAVVMVGIGSKYGGSMGLDLLGLLLSFILAVGYEYIFYSVDYKGTERLSFEDDDYFYYVKAVPKIRPYDEDERRE